MKMYKLVSKIAEINIAFYTEKDALDYKNKFEFSDFSPIEIETNSEEEQPIPEMPECHRADGSVIDPFETDSAHYV